MNCESLYQSDNDDDDDDNDDMLEDLEDLRRACIVPEPNSASVVADGGGTPSDSENEDDFEMLRSIKSQFENNVDLSVPSESESEDDFELLRSIKSLLALPMDEDEDGAFKTLRSIRRRFSAFDKEGDFTSDTPPGKKKQVHALDKEPSSKILSRSNTCEPFLDQGNLVPSIEPLDHTVTTCQSSLVPAASSRFPESARALRYAIQKNRSYQELLRRKLGEIEATIEQNEKHKKNVMIVKDTHWRSVKRALSHWKDPHIELISTRKCDKSEGDNVKTTPLSLGPPENPCVSKYRMAHEKHPVSVDRRNWSTKENEYLAKGLKQQVQQALVLEATERSSELEGSTDDIDTILEAITNLEITPEMIRRFLPRVNWDQLDIKDRSAAECEARWMSTEDPLINKDPWTAAEDDYIRLVTRNKSFTDWLDVAVSLGTNRTPFDCLARYQRSLNPCMLGEKWTPEEDGKLRDAVDRFGENNWQSVANALGGRSGPQCSQRWKMLPNIERKDGRGHGEWSSEEEKRLKVAVTFFGAANWRKIAEFVPGRTDAQCSAKWRDNLDPKVERKRMKWTEEEEAKLNEVVKEHGPGKWSNIASHLPGRTGVQCNRRWKKLNPHLARLVQEKTKLRREATVGNFVDRESDRPDFGACKFLALADDISLDEPEKVAPKKKRNARQNKSTERQPKRRRRALGRSSEQENATASENEGEIRLLEWHNESEDNVKKKKRQRSNKSSVPTTNSTRVETGLKKLKPRRKVSSLVPIEYACLK